jgi:hypothetical protein
MSSFSCPHYAQQSDACLRLDDFCVPGRPGCVLPKNTVFATGTGCIQSEGNLYSLRDLIVNCPASLLRMYPRDMTDANRACGAALIQNPDGTTSKRAVIPMPVPKS